MPKEENELPTPFLMFGIPSADGFFDVARATSPRRATANPSILDENPIGQLCVSAVNLAFSIELYLKVILRGLGLEKFGHRLAEDLFDKLPEDVQADMSSVFNTMLDRFESEEPLYIPRGFHFSSSQEKINEVRHPSRNESPTLRVVLLEHSDAFVKWRYLLEGPNDKNHDFDTVFSLYADFHHLMIAAGAIRGVVKRITTESGWTFSMERRCSDE